MALAGYPEDEMKKIINGLPLLQDLGHTKLEFRLWIILQTFFISNDNYMEPRKLVLNPCTSLMKKGFNYESILDELEILEKQKFVESKAYPMKTNEVLVYQFRLSPQTLFNINKFFMIINEKAIKSNYYHNELLFSDLGFNIKNDNFQGFFKKWIGNMKEMTKLLLHLNGNDAVIFIKFIYTIFANVG